MTLSTSDREPEHVQLIALMTVILVGLFLFLVGLGMCLGGENDALRPIGVFCLTWGAMIYFGQITAIHANHPIAAFAVNLQFWMMLSVAAGGVFFLLFIEVTLFLVLLIPALIVGALCLCVIRYNWGIRQRARLAVNPDMSKYGLTTGEIFAAMAVFSMLFILLVPLFR